jgi:hypothetical protein
MALYHPDFDDAYQYTAAGEHGLVLVSFDTDFDINSLTKNDPGASPVRKHTRWHHLSGHESTGRK